MIVPQVTHLILRQPQSIIPFPALPPPILHPQTDDEAHHKHSSHDQQRQINREPRSIKRCLRSREYETGDDTAGIPQANLQTRGDGSLVSPAHVIRHHGPKQWQGDVRPGLDEIKGRVSDTPTHLPLIQQDYEADEAEQVAEFGESEAVA